MRATRYPVLLVNVHSGAILFVDTEEGLDRIERDLPSWQPRREAEEVSDGQGA